MGRYCENRIKAKQTARLKVSTISKDVVRVFRPANDHGVPVIFMPMRRHEGHEGFPRRRDWDSGAYNLDVCPLIVY